MRYRWLALDIDGTLLNSRGQLTDLVIGAVGKAQEYGWEVSLVSGRRLRGMVDIARQLKIGTPLIAFNGAVVAIPDGCRLLSCHTLERQLLAPILHSWESQGMTLFANTSGLASPDLYSEELSGSLIPVKIEQEGGNLRGSFRWWERSNKIRYAWS